MITLLEQLAIIMRPSYMRPDDIKKGEGIPTISFPSPTEGQTHKSRSCTVEDTTQNSVIANFQYHQQTKLQLTMELSELLMKLWQWKKQKEAPGVGQAFPETQTYAWLNIIMSLWSFWLKCKSIDTFSGLTITCSVNKYKVLAPTVKNNTFWPLKSGLPLSITL